MNKKQHRLSNTALISGFVGIWFAVDYYNLSTANDLTQFGNTVVPWLIGISFAVCGMATLARIVDTYRK